jgi:hypothetical protein
MEPSGLVAIGIVSLVGVIAADISATNGPAPKYETIADCVPYSKSASGNYSYRDDAKCRRHVPATYSRVVPVDETGAPIPGMASPWVPAAEVYREQAKWERYSEQRKVFKCHSCFGDHYSNITTTVETITR